MRKYQNGRSMQAIFLSLGGVVSSGGPEVDSALSEADFRTPYCGNGFVWGSERGGRTPDRFRAAGAIPMYRNQWKFSSFAFFHPISVFNLPRPKLFREAIPYHGGKLR